MNQTQEIRIPIELTIKAEESGEGVNKKSTPEATQKKLKNQTLTNASKTVAMHMGKQAASYALANYGNLTGDNFTQAIVQDSINIGGDIAIALSSPIGAFMIGGKTVLQAHKRYVDIQKSTDNANRLLERMGLAKDGSR
jgi:hypothetical protein